MLNWLWSLLTGIGVGLIFSLFKLPIPAPNNLSGVLGIVGVFVGFLIAEFFRRRI